MLFEELINERRYLFSAEICGTAYFVRKSIVYWSKCPSALLILMHLRFVNLKVLNSYLDIM